MIELEFNSSHYKGNAYTFYLPDKGSPNLTAVFEGISGSCAGKKMVIPGFWDGGNSWKIRFSPPMAGEWRFITRSRDSLLDGRRGTIQCGSWSELEKKLVPTRRGLINVNHSNPGAGRFFVYTDGTPFLWIGDTWWFWSKPGIHFSSMKKLIDDRAEKGFTIGKLFFVGDGAELTTSLLNETYDEPDLEQIRKVEKMISYANEKGLTVWISGWWGTKNLGQKAGTDNIRRWWKYIIHRLSAYNVIWVMAGEYNMYNYSGLGLDFWKSLGKMVKKEDPYKRVISMHPTPPTWSPGIEASQWSTDEILNAETWLDYNQSQTGHSEWANGLTPQIVKNAYKRVPNKPIVVTEPWYELIVGNAPASHIRFSAWSAFLSGAAGHSYGSGPIYRAHVQEAPTILGKTHDSSPFDTSFLVNPLNFPGAQSISYLSKFLKKFSWWKLIPHPELISLNLAAYCSAEPGKNYVVYLRYGGNIEVDLAKGVDYNFEWIDLEKEKEISTGAISGGGKCLFKCPGPENLMGGDRDRLLHIYRR